MDKKFSSRHRTNLWTQQPPLPFTRSLLKPQDPDEQSITGRSIKVKNTHPYAGLMRFEEWKWLSRQSTSSPYTLSFLKFKSLFYECVWCFKKKMLKCVKAVDWTLKNKYYTIKKHSELLSIRIHIKISLCTSYSTFFFIYTNTIYL